MLSTVLFSLILGAAAAPAPPIVSTVSANYTHATYNPFGAPPTYPSATTTGAVSTTVLAPSVPALPPGPDARAYKADGFLHGAQPAPYTPSGGLGTNGSEPVYVPNSDFDFQTLEWTELDLFHDGLAKFSVADFEAAGLTAADRFLIEFMADQEVGHVTVLTNMLGAAAPVQCEYMYPYKTVREFVDFCQKLTRVGESGVYGFLPHLNSGPAAQILLQSITTEARQQMIFRQFEGLFPMPVWYEAGIPGSWAWTLLAPYIRSCPANQTRLVWQNFPALTVVNNPNPYRINPNNTGSNETISSISQNETCGIDCNPAITRNRTALSYPGRVVHLSWDTPGKPIGPNGSYVTSQPASIGAPAFVAWVSQLNVTYSALTNVSGNSGMTIQPDMSTFAGDPAINGTMFVAITDAALPLSPFNVSMINSHVYAGPALYQSG